jgi:arsenite-transporting ATPase
VKFTFVGGKGGVGKTTTSSAIALISSDSAMRTLLVSTDPAHSLGDAVGVDLSSGLVTPIPSEQYLWGLEIDVDGALAEFKNTVSELDTADLASSFGIPTELVELFGINEIADIFANPPPGIDEIIALTKIFQFADKMDGTGTRQMYDRIVIDTAPTGTHTAPPAASQIPRHTGRTPDPPAREADRSAGHVQKLLRRPEQRRARSQQAEHAA